MNLSYTTIMDVADPLRDFDKGILARTLIGLCGQVASLPDQRQAYGSSPLVKSLNRRRRRRLRPGGTTNQEMIVPVNRGRP